jgi:hypothetical protein
MSCLAVADKHKDSHFTPKLLVDSLSKLEAHMKLAAALLVILWWICLWGLADLLTESWTREERLIAYTAGALFVVAIAVLFPQIWDRL